jgi:hypothetical protein
MGEVLELLDLYDVIQLGTGDLEVRANEVVQLVPSLGHLRLWIGKTRLPLLDRERAYLEDIRDERHAATAARASLRLRLDVGEIVNALLDALPDRALRHVLSRRQGVSPAS